MDPTSAKVAARFVQARTAQRVVARFMAARAPHVTLNGKKYVLSDQWAMIGDLVDQLGGGKPGGPKVIDMNKGKPKRFSWLWAYDPDKQMVGMWRWSDGSEKLYGRATQYMRDLNKLQERGQLNRVTTNEMKALTRAMRRKESDTLKQMKEDLAAQATEFERKIGQMVRDFFKKEVVPKVKAQWVMIETGWRPDGFEVNPRMLDFKSEEQQAKAHAAFTIFQEGFSLDKIDAYVVDQFDGLNPLDNPEVDIQLTYWERNDVIDEFYERNRT